MVAARQHVEDGDSAPHVRLLNLAFCNPVNASISAGEPYVEHRSSSAARCGAGRLADIIAPGLFPRTAPAAAATACAVGGVLLTLDVRQRQLYPGESHILSFTHRVFGGVLGPIAGLLDDLFTDASATVVYAVLWVVVLGVGGVRAAAAFTVAGAGTSLARLGNLVDRPRPDGRLMWSENSLDAGGFPSGHVVYFVLVFGTIACLARGLPRLARVIVQSVSIFLVVLIGPLRLVALDHWPADVVGGYALALPALWLVICLHRGIEAKWPASCSTTAVTSGADSAEAESSVNDTAAGVTSRSSAISN
jgi:undecaprenyl-diphosphatase